MLSLYLGVYALPAYLIRGVEIERCECWLLIGDSVLGCEGVLG